MRAAINSFGRFSWLAVLCGVLQVITVILLAGLIGIVVGYVAYLRNEDGWKLGMLASVVGIFLALTTHSWIVIAA